MPAYQSGPVTIRIDQHEPATGRQNPALLLLHGSGGAGSYWLDRFAPNLLKFGIAAYAPRYFDRTGTARATPEMILDGKHFAEWLIAIQDAVTYIASRPGVDRQRIGVMGMSLGGYLAVALGVEDSRIRAVIELSGGVPRGWEDRIAPEMPPVLILHGDADKIVPVSEAHKLGSLLQRRGTTHEVNIFAGETHWLSTASYPRLLMSCTGFLGRYL